MTNFKKGIFYFEKLDNPNLVCAISSKKIGDLRRTNGANLERFCKLIGIESGNIVRAEQVHGNNIAQVGDGDLGQIIKGVDGLITREKNIYLLMVVADCLPLVFYDPVLKIAGIVHAGWRGSAENISREMIRKFAELGSDSQNIQVGIGPGICQKHYEVGKEVADLFASQHLKTVNGKFYLDLRFVNISQLVGAGVNSKNIENINICTFEEENRFYSWRREKPNLSGEIAAIIGMRE